MPIQKQKPSSSAKADPKSKSAKSRELGDDELRTISGGMTSGGSTGSTPPVCISQT
jgi:hypothetical protein